MWQVIGASVAGTAHQAAGREGEDACGWRAAPGLTCLAGADGGGPRAKVPDRGAAGAGSALLRWPPGARGEGAAWLRLIFAAAREQITARALADGKDAGDYATTLAVAVLTGAAVAVGQIGDTIAVAGRAGKYETLTPAPRAEYVNETAFLTG